jgi:HEAT repeat protein
VKREAAMNKTKRYFYGGLLLLALLARFLLPPLWIYFRDVYLVQMVLSSKGEHRWAPSLLVQIGEKEKVIPVLSQALQTNPDYLFRREAVLALAQIEDRDKVMPILAKILNTDPEWWVRDPAAIALLNMGKSALPILQQTLQENPDWEVRASVLLALTSTKVPKDPELLVPLGLIGLYDKSSSSGNRRVAALALMRLRQSAVPIFMKELEQPKWPGIIDVMLALSDLEFLDCDIKEAIPVIRKIFEDPSTPIYYRRCVLGVFRKRLGPSAVSIFLKDLEQPQWPEAMDAIKVIGDLKIWDYDIEEAIPVIRKILENPSTPPIFQKDILQLFPGIEQK